MSLLKHSNAIHRDLVERPKKWQTALTIFVLALAAYTIFSNWDNQKDDPYITLEVLD